MKNCLEQGVNSEYRIKEMIWREDSNASHKLKEYKK